MILRRDGYAAGFKVLHRLVSATMTELEFERFAPQRMGEHLVTEANAEGR